MRQNIGNTDIAVISSDWDIHLQTGSKKLSQSVQDNARQSLNSSIREHILKNFLDVFSSDPRILIARTFWSTSRGNFTEFSDVDLLLVVKQDELESFKKAIIAQLKKSWLYLWHWQYEDNHFYVVHQNLIPLDLYIVWEEESRAILQRWEKKAAIFHILWLNTGIRDLPLEPCKDAKVWNNNPTSYLEANEYDVNFGKFRKALTRGFRLLSKLEKDELIEFVYIINSIREDDLIPLFTSMGIDFPNAKKVKLWELPQDIRELFIRTFAQPTTESCYTALCALMGILEIILKHMNDNSDNQEKPSELATIWNWLNFSIDRIKKYEWQC